MLRNALSASAPATRRNIDSPNSRPSLCAGQASQAPRLARRPAHRTPTGQPGAV